MLESWAHIEADFKREYNIDLTQDIKKMSFRRFVNLLKCLSVNSNWYALNNAKQDIIEDPLLAERAVNRIWG
jgi:hypothetical protein